MKTLLFDGDDTLFPTQKEYDKTSLFCATRIKSFFYIQENEMEIIQKMNEIDLKNMKKFGFSPERFPTSWAQTYEYFALQKGQLISESKKRSIYLSAQSIFRKNISVYEDVHETLKNLKEKGHKLILLTAGVKEIQEKRIQDANIRPYFDEIIITPMKNTEILRTLLKERSLNPSECIMIGNSLRSDIHPSLEVGMEAVHIDCETWDYDQFEVDTTHPNYVAIPHVKHVENAIKTMKKRKLYA